MNTEKASVFLKAMANEYRLQVIILLTDGELSVSQLNERLDLSQSALSQHLAKLREAGLVSTRRASQTIYYRLSDDAHPTRPILKTLRIHYV